jgi:hypothetical protein
MVLGAEKKARTYYCNQLFEQTIAALDPRLSPFPYNPRLKMTLIKTMLKLGLYNRYKKAMVKYF